MKSAANLGFRPATPADAWVVAEIYNESILAGDSSMEERVQSSESIRELMAGFNRREGILLLESFDPGTPGRPSVLGWGLIKRYSDRRGYRFAAETAVYLRRSEVGQGHGSRIKQALIDRCRELGYHHLVAKIFADNQLSLEYNKKFGYELVGIQKQIGYRNGRWQDIAVLQLVLSDVPPEIPVPYRENTEDSP